MARKKKHDDVNPFDGYLGEGETLLWIGRPNPYQLFSPTDLYLVPFSLMWGGFAIFWEMNALGSGSSLFQLWGIPFVVIGEYLIWGRFLYKYLRRQNTVYAVTDRRALVLNRLFGDNLKAYFLHKFSSLQRRGKAIVFDLNDSATVPRRNALAWAGESQPRFYALDWSSESRPGFYALADADDVYHLLQDLIWQPKAKNAWD